MTRAFLTGGAGFIGLRLAQALRAEGMEVTVYDNLHPQIHGPDAASPALPEGTRFVLGDVCDAPALSAALNAAAPDLIFHLAAETGTGQSYDLPSRYCSVNVDGTCHLIEAIRDLPPGKRRLVLAGSRAVYGEGAHSDVSGAIVVPGQRSIDAMRAGRFDPVDEDGRPLQPVATSETTPPSPSSIYASTKLMQEHLVRQGLVDAGVDVVVLRFQNVYGPGQSLRNPYTGVLSIFAAQILAGKTLNIYEDGEIVRDFVYVDDVVQALVLASSSKVADSAPINIGSGDATTISQAAEVLLRALGAPTDRKRTSGDFRAGDIRFALADISRAAKILGWTPKVSLAQGLQRLADWAASSSETAA